MTISFDVAVGWALVLAAMFIYLVLIPLEVIA
jgi:hypothetical protein